MVRYRGQFVTNIYTRSFGSNKEPGYILAVTDTMDTVFHGSTLHYVVGIPAT